MEKVRRRSRAVFFAPASLKRVETAEKQGRYSMENAIKDIRAGSVSDAEISSCESISKTKSRFSFAKNPARRAAENGAFPNPRGKNKTESFSPRKYKRLFASTSVKRNEYVRIELSRSPTAQRKIRLMVLLRYSRLLSLASCKSMRIFGI